MQIRGIYYPYLNVWVLPAREARRRAREVWYQVEQASELARWYILACERSCEYLYLWTQVDDVIELGTDISRQL